MTAQAIKHAALQLFARSGYEGADVSDIAARAGIKAPSLHPHFRSKQELFLSALEDVLREHMQSIAELLQESKLRREATDTILRRLIREYCHNERMSGERAFFLKRALLLPPPFLASGLKERLMLMEQQLAEPVGRLLEEAYAAGELRSFNKPELVASYLCLMDSCLMQSYLLRTQQIDEWLGKVWPLFWEGIGKR
ncbi:TetR/AcrR family transcriptional regulator [Paenibacillus allorhizosphaerae]|uniref:HTH tetR-type domain-containing protein n=1 Tax=Paenibacillus allorhizosphaerae TaxID=2849866 RepID=A0ABM8VTL8_9BACL|nr:TetR/AcrR family transcriptional regulator [Paenibacillus allorhizosphaerae]CAG7657904.1 hypothetical protein PAECIP111802_06892 [Paenibacillus allorhizosphaerae]